MNYDEAINYICSTPWTARERGHMRILELLERLGNPHRNMKYIHVAGTNGKGSTSSMLASILECSGLKTGLFTSPHLLKYNERMKINGEDISDDELALVMSEIAPIADNMAVSPSEYELLSAAGFLWFYRNNCDVVVLEVGMGGELDSTNVIEDKDAAVITAIGFDHMSILGNTLEEITATKAGIITGPNDVILYRQADTIMNVVKQRCNEMNASLHVPEENIIRVIDRSIDYSEVECSFISGSFRFPLIGQYQIKNLEVVLETCRILREKGYSLSDEVIREGIEKTKWATRFEVVGKRPVFIIDGAHNEQGINAAVESLKSLFPDKKVVYILGVLADKSFDKMLEVLYENSNMFITLTPNSNRALPSEDLANIIRTSGHDANAFESIEEAIDFALDIAGEDGIICSLGSLYLAGEIRKKYLEIVGRIN